MRWQLSSIISVCTCINLLMHVSVYGIDEENIKQNYLLELCHPTYSEGDILFLVWILLALALVSESHFLVCTITCEPVVGFLPNLHGYIIGA